MDNCSDCCGYRKPLDYRNNPKLFLSTEKIWITSLRYPSFIICSIWLDCEALRGANGYVIPQLKSSHLWVPRLLNWKTSETEQWKGASLSQYNDCRRHGIELERQNQKLSRGLNMLIAHLQHRSLSCYPRNHLHSFCQTLKWNTGQEPFQSSTAPIIIGSVN